MDIAIPLNEDDRRRDGPSSPQIRSNVEGVAVPKKRRRKPRQSPLVLNSDDSNIRSGAKPIGNILKNEAEGEVSRILNRFRYLSKFTRELIYAPDGDACAGGLVAEVYGCLG